VPPKYAGDNGAMIAYLAYLMYKSGIKKTNLKIDPNFRTDHVEVTW
jgi:tRNA A37 threonylcarbamoyltransferase TsaD